MEKLPPLASPRGSAPSTPGPGRKRSQHAPVLDRDLTVDRALLRAYVQSQSFVLVEDPGSAVLQAKLEALRAEAARAKAAVHAYEAGRKSPSDSAKPQSKLA
jgi:hypothetical protein